MLLRCPRSGSVIAPQIIVCEKDTKLFVVLLHNKAHRERLHNCTVLSGLSSDTNILNVRIHDEQPCSPDDKVMEKSGTEVRVCTYTLCMQPCLSCCGVLCKSYIVVDKNVKV